MLPKWLKRKGILELEKLGELVKPNAMERFKKMILAKVKKHVNSG